MRRLCAGTGQLTQGQVTQLALSEWARLHLSPEVQDKADLGDRLTLSLRMAGYEDYTYTRVCAAPPRQQASMAT